jgi:heat shock protein HslJ
MRNSLLLLIIAVIFANCQPEKSGTGSGASNRWRNKSGADNSAADSVTITGAEYVPVYGRNENGVKPTLEGSWELESMEGYKWETDVVEKLKALENNKYAADSNGQLKVPQGAGEEARITPNRSDKYHIPEKPSISFFGMNETFSGYTGCNKYTGRYVMEDTSSKISLKTAAAATKMVCLVDKVEQTFLNHLKSVEKFRGTSGRLELLAGDKVVMTFRKKADQK